MFRKRTASDYSVNAVGGSNWPVVLLAAFAAIWIVCRAVVQSITLDEADTWYRWVSTDFPSHWEPHSNNHVLNSTLMRLSIWLFGLSHLTVRMPALLGGFLYIFSMYRLCALLTHGRVLAGALFLCLVYNPFIMDYLVAARGYGLALGFLGLAMYFFARAVIRTEAQPGEREMLSAATAISACIGLSICANFAFAFADGFLLLVAAVLASVWMTRQKVETRTWGRLALSFALPVLGVLLVFAGSALTQFPRDQLFWGTNSLVTMFRDIRDASFVELNPYLVNPLLAQFLQRFESHALMALTLPAIAYLILLFAVRTRLREPNVRLRLLLIGSWTCVLAMAVAAHWIQFKLFKIPLPLERISIWIVPLFTGIFGVVFSVMPSRRLERAVRGFGVAALMLTGLYFAGELRNSYFREWRECAELKAAFPVIVDFCRHTGVREVPSDFAITPSLRFYKYLYRVNEIEKFSADDKLPAGSPIYVLLESKHADFIKAENLKVAWHATLSDVAVLVREAR